MENIKVTLPDGSSKQLPKGSTGADLALAIVAHCEEKGMECIPVLLRWTLKRVVTMANGNT